MNTIRYEYDYNILRGSYSIVIIPIYSFRLASALSTQAASTVSSPVSNMWHDLIAEQLLPCEAAR